MKTSTIVIIILFWLMYQQIRIYKLEQRTEGMTDCTSVNMQAIQNLNEVAANIRNNGTWPGNMTVTGKLTVMEGIDMGNTDYHKNILATNGGYIKLGNDPKGGDPTITNTGKKLYIVSDGKSANWADI